MATTMLATLAVSPLSTALAQTAEPPPAEAGGAIALPTIEVIANREGEGPGSSQGGAGLGGRYDWADFGFGFSTNSIAEANDPFNPATGFGFRNAFDKAFSPCLGAVVQPTPWLSFYGDYVKSFGATNGIPAPGNPPFPPEIGTQYEGGAKTEFLDKRLTATMAFYDITKSNIVQTIPGTPFSRPVGLVESKGVEFDIAGRINENWSLIGNYAYDEARITKDVTGEQGNRLENVPFNAGNIWVKYDAGGDFRGLSLGGGVFVFGERQGDHQNDFQLPACARVDTASSRALFPGCRI